MLTRRGAALVLSASPGTVRDAMLARISKRYTFDSAHLLPDHDGKCARPHGHTYGVEVVCLAEVRDEAGHPKDGMALDFAAIDAAMSPLLGELDHQDLNELTRRKPTSDGELTTPRPYWLDHSHHADENGHPVPVPTTAEHLAGYFLRVLAEHFELPVLEVSVSETPKTTATVSRRMAGLRALPFEPPS